MTAFGELLREYRTRIRLSQNHLGPLAGVDKTYISHLEAGKRHPSLSAVLRIADALELGPADELSLIMAAVADARREVAV